MRGTTTQASYPIVWSTTTLRAVNNFSPLSLCLKRKLFFKSNTVLITLFAPVPVKKAAAPWMTNLNIHSFFD